MGPGRVTVGTVSSISDAEESMPMNTRQHNMLVQLAFWTKPGMAIKKFIGHGSFFAWGSDN